MARFLSYLLVVLIFGLGVSFVIQAGRKLPPPPNSTAVSAASVAPAVSTATEPSASLYSHITAHLQDPLARLLIQLIVIVAVARLVGWFAARIGQPSVIGEMLAGIILGPSLVGWLWPDFFQFVFPATSLGPLRLMSQIGVCLFMFVIGMELDVAHLKHQARTAVLVSQVSIIFPFLLGLVLSLFLYSTMAGPRASFVVFALFIGIAVSITAFPVLARILEDRGLTKTPLGSTALVCAATDDVTAWSLLAVVAAMAQAKSVSSAIFSVGLVVLFVATMLFVIKPLLPRLLDRTAQPGGTPGKGIMAAVLVFLMVSALITDVMGVHAIFGAFLAGIVMPGRHELREFLRVRIENFSSVFLLPLFFAFTGLRTQFGLLADDSDWLLCLGIILLATVGKLGGAMLTARLTGVNWIDSFALGALMNTRGLVELIALNIGYDLGIISPRIFTMLVIMALVTTAMTGPLLSLAHVWRTRRASVPVPA